MSFVLADRVKDTSTTEGTGSFTVSGTAPTGFQTFDDVMSSDDTTFYAIGHQTLGEWEVGVGTYSGSNVLARTTVLASSNSGSKVNFSAGAKNVFMDAPASKIALYDASNNLAPPGDVSATGAISGSNLSGTNTGDQTSVTGNAGTATKLATARNIDGQAFDGSANVTVIAPGTHAATSKTTPVDADEIPLVDSEDSNLLKKLTWANLKATLKTYFDSLYTTELLFVIGDGANVITEGVKGYLPIDFGGTIVSWTAVADVSGDIVIAIWKDTFANFPPTSDDRMTGVSDYIALSSAQKAQSSDLSGWVSTTFDAGDVFAINTGAATSIKQVTLSLKVTKA